MSTLTLQNASFSYDKHYDPTRAILHNLSLTVSSGEILAVLGPNGSGKTTLLKCMLNLLKLKEGECLLNGKPVQTLPVREFFGKVSYVPQTRSIPTSYSVLETVLLGLSGKTGVFKAPGEKDILEAEECLTRLKIGHLKDKRCNELSGGELQMVFIARALISKPEILVLDEPESGLDFKNQLIVLETLADLKKEGMACVFNTHYPEHALRFADKALLLYEGRSLFGTTEEVITEKNVREAFGVEAHIGTYEIDGTQIKTVIPIRKST